MTVVVELHGLEVFGYHGVREEERRDGRTFVYQKTPNGFMPHDVKLVRRSESQVVLDGLKEGDVIAMSNPGRNS